MMLSTRGRYGLKAMVDLALSYGQGLMSTAALAQKQSVSTSYLEQLVAALKKAGLILGARGAQGGYELARRPEDITVGEVLDALEGATTLVECVGKEKVSCDNACSCSARPLCLKLQSRINEVLDTTTLSDMAEDYRIQMERSDMLNNTGAKCK